LKGVNSLLGLKHDDDDGRIPIFCNIKPMKELQCSFWKEEEKEDENNV
jgi:hypothetical protein